jgi:hypothetical protein
MNMYRIKALLASVLVVAGICSVVSATASAEVNGPWWKHLNGLSEQVKFPENEERQLKTKNEGNFKLRIIFLGEKVVIECTAVKGSGWLWNGLHQGEDEAEELNFENCITNSPGLGECKVEIAPLKNIYSELMWKYRGEKKEREEAPKGTQQKIYDAFGVAANSEGKFVLTTITTLKPCAVAEKFPLTAAGTEQVFVDQHKVNHTIKWFTAALVEPQNEDKQKGFLKWTVPNQRKLHHQEKEVIAKLEFGGQPAELEGKLAVELNNSEVFGAFNE